MNQIRAIRGMNDILPDETWIWQYLEGEIRQLLNGYAYQEIRLPVVEQTALFSRAIGEVTDIVEKEMYTFPDRNDESLALRPEGTAGCVRAGIQHGLLNRVQKLWYLGPMFRYERPQKGRQRQFHQVGAEVFGAAGAEVEAELILLTARLWRELGIENAVELQLNSLGDIDSRARYRTALVEYLRENSDQLDEDSLRRLDSNPLRVLDSKSPSTQAVLENAPVLADFLDAESAEHFARLQQLLSACGLKYTINNRLVRGLDYYNRTVFEWVTDALGAQGTVCGGGRYDSLVEQLGGKPVPAAGFAMGLERLILLIQELSTAPVEPGQADVYFVTVGAAAEVVGLQLAEKLRQQLPASAVQVHCGGGSFKSQLKKADKSGASLAVILGERECETEVAGLKIMRGENVEGQQLDVPFAELGQRIIELIEQEDG